MGGTYAMSPLAPITTHRDGFELYCEKCGHNYYSVGSSTWYTPGSVSVYPSYGYCGACCGGTRKGWTWTGNAVKIRCAGCSNIYGVVTHADWWGYMGGESVGYCNGCHASS